MACSSCGSVEGVIFCSCGTMYCSRSCRTAHKPEHKDFCKTSAWKKHPKPHRYADLFGTLPIWQAIVDADARSNRAAAKLDRVTAGSDRVAALTSLYLKPKKSKIYHVPGGLAVVVENNSGTLWETNPNQELTDYLGSLPEQLEYVVVLPWGGYYACFECNNNNPLIVRIRKGVHTCLELTFPKYPKTTTVPKTPEDCHKENYVFGASSAPSSAPSSCDIWLGVAENGKPSVFKFTLKLDPHVDLMLKVGEDTLQVDDMQVLALRMEEMPLGLCVTNHQGNDTLLIPTIYGVQLFVCLPSLPIARMGLVLIRTHYGDRATLSGMQHIIACKKWGNCRVTISNDTRLYTDEDYPWTGNMHGQIKSINDSNIIIDFNGQRL